MRQRLVIFAALLSIAASPWAHYSESSGPARPQATTAEAVLPNRADSLKIAVLGDMGTGSRRQYEVADTMAKVHATFPFRMVLLTGDNIYGSERPQDFRRKFEIPYKSLLDAGVRFYASLGNHDSREQRFYKPFNMEGRLYYSLKAPLQDVRFFAFESTYPEPDQIAWLDGALREATEAWKVVFFHHPLYSSGERHGSDTRLREVIEPLLVAHGVSIVFTGHDHFYERITPQKGILHFVVGSGGQLRRGNINTHTGLTAAGLDTDNAFLVGEFAGDRFSFQAISRTGQVVDSGTFTRRRPGDIAPGQDP